MARVRIIILCVIVSILCQEGLLSKTSKSKRPPRKGKARHAAPRRVTQKPPDPALQWTDCGEQCISPVFGNKVAPIRIAPVNGELRGIAVQGDHLYLLVKNFNLIIDAVFRIRRSNGKIESIWGIGRHDAEAIASDGENLWIASRSEKYFLRKLTFAGRGAGERAVTILPEGSISGLACAGDSIFFSLQYGDGSSIYRFSKGKGSMEKIGSYGGAIHGLALSGGMLVAHVEEFDRYANGWLLVVCPAAGKVKKRLSYAKVAPAAMTGDGELLYALESRKTGSVVYTAVARMDRNVVMADPRVQRVTLTFPVAGKNHHAYNADLWIPYPINRPLQNVRQVTIEPRPVEIVNDRYGNRWARVHWSGVKGKVSARLGFDIITSAAAVTVEPGYHYNDEDVPADVRSSTKGETYACDISSYIIKSHSTRIDGEGAYLDRILAVRDYVNGAVRFSAYVDRWGKASEYLFRGRGDAYGRTLGFAALSRYLGIPSRAAGALRLESRAAGTDTSATWNQVYMPGAGWIDIGIGRDYGNARERFAGRPNRYFVTFEGDFDKKDYSEVFVETEWSGVCRWSSVDEVRKADVAFGPVRIEARDLKE